MKRNKILFLLAYVFLTSGLVLLIKPYYFYSILIVLGPPTIINFYWLKKSRMKIFLFSLISTIFFAFPIELATRLADVWDVQTIFFRPFGLIPFENMLFAFINFFWGLSFYEYFVDRDKKNKISNKIKYLVGLYVIFAVLIYGLYFYNENMVAMNYFIISAPVLIIPSIIIFFKNPGLIKKTILPTLFFAIVFFVYEMVSIYIGSWWWPGEYFYSFEILGNTFPLDDVVIWYFLSTPALIGGYEFFADDYA